MWKIILFLVVLVIAIYYWEVVSPVLRDGLDGADSLIEFLRGLLSRITPSDGE